MVADRIESSVDFNDAKVLNSKEFQLVEVICAAVSSIIPGRLDPI